MLANLKARFPRLFPAVTTALVLSVAGSATAYEQMSKSCCGPGAACCYPGSPCCNGAHLAQK